MRHENVTATTAGPSAPLKRGPDWKAAGYIVSIVGVLLLGAIAWPTPAEPAWHAPVLIGGMAASIIGMGCRYKAHRDQQRELRETKAEARQH
jgi:hypothetical protein